MKYKFTEYTELPRQKLIDAAYSIQKLSNIEISKIILKRFSVLFGHDHPEIPRIKDWVLFDIHDVRDCGIRVNLNPDTFGGTQLEQLNGMANTIYGEHRIPIIFMVRSQNNVFEQESIHASQFLFDAIYPLTKIETDKLYGIDSLSVFEVCDWFYQKYPKKDYWDFIIRFSVFKFWTELEAVYTTQFKNYSQLLEKAYRSSELISTIEQFHSIYKMPGIYLNIAREKVEEYLEQMVIDINWLNVLRKDIDTSFHDDVHWVHEDWETDQMLGPLEDEEDFNLDQELGDY